jgi:hypothetical protein
MHFHQPISYAQVFDVTCNCTLEPPLQIMQYGLMSKLSTGYSLLDALLVMLVPLLVNRLLPQIHTFVQNFFSRAAPPEQTHERHIIHKQNPNRNWWYSSDDDEHPNHKLQQAIIVYLNTLPDVFSQLESCDVQLCKAKRKPNAAAACESSEEAIHAAAASGESSSSSSSDDDWYPGVCMHMRGYAARYPACPLILTRAASTCCHNYVEAVFR